MKKLNGVLAALGLMFIGTAAIAQNDFPSSGRSGVGTNGSPDASFEITSSTIPPNEDGSPVTNYPGLLVSHWYGDALNNIVDVRNVTSFMLNGQPALINQPYFQIRGDGRVRVFKSLRIGSGEPASPYANYKLSVDGDIIAKRCVIQVSNWADFVFSEKYELMPLSDLSDFVTTNKHLPGVPKEDEVLANGIETGEMSKILLQKVEELTLYMIQLKKENIELKNRLTQIEQNKD